MIDLSSQAIDELVRISSYAGESPLLVQGGGGNGSVKDPSGETMWIKASGLRMAAVQPSSGFVELEVARVNAITRSPELAQLDPKVAHEESVRLTQALSAGSFRPSMETGFHALLDRVVLHTHAVYINAFACMDGGEEALSRVADTPVLWIDYLTPGYALSVALDEGVRRFTDTHGAPPKAIVLGNHGFIANARTAEEAIVLTKQFETLGRSFFGEVPEGALDRAHPKPQAIRWALDLESLLPNALTVRPATFRTITEAADRPELLASGALIPDDVIYSGDTVFVADPDTESPAEWLARTFTQTPDKFVLVVPDAGVVLAGPAKTLDAIEENLLAHVLVRFLIERKGTARPLPRADVLYLQSMESEKYRQAVAAGKLGGA